MSIEAASLKSSPPQFSERPHQGALQRAIGHPLFEPRLFGLVASFLQPLEFPILPFFQELVLQGKGAKGHCTEMERGLEKIYEEALLDVKKWKGWTSHLTDLIRRSTPFDQWYIRAAGRVVLKKDPIFLFTLFPLLIEEGRFVLLEKFLRGPALGPFFFHLPVVKLMQITRAGVQKGLLLPLVRFLESKALLSPSLLEALFWSSLFSWNEEDRDELVRVASFVATPSSLLETLLLKAPELEDPSVRGDLASELLQKFGSQ